MTDPKPSPAPRPAPEGYPATSDDVRCPTCGRPWADHDASCSRHAYRPIIDVNAELLAGVREAEAVIAGKAPRRPVDALVPPGALTDVQVPGDRVAGIADDPEEVVDLEEVVANLAVDLAGMHNERDSLLGCLVYQTYDDEGGGPFWTWTWKGVNQGQVASFAEGVRLLRKAAGLDTGDPEPPSLDIYAGREPFEGRGVPEVPGTPEYAPEPAKARRGRKAKDGAS